MCGRFYIDENDEIERIVAELLQRGPKEGLKTSGEIRPTDIVAVLANDKKQCVKPFAMKWGYTSWDGKILFNARSETAADKKTFSEDIMIHRCLIPATCYYEWDRKTKQKEKYTISLAGSNMFYLAGIYRMELSQAVFTILTKEPAQNIHFIHDRMPVIISSKDKDKWLNLNITAQEGLKAAVNSVEYIKSI